MRDQHASLLLSIAHAVERREEALVELSVAFDRYLEETHGGVVPEDDEPVDETVILVSGMRLENAIHKAIGLPPRHGERDIQRVMNGPQHEKA